MRGLLRRQLTLLIPLLIVNYTYTRTYNENRIVETTHHFDRGRNEVNESTSPNWGLQGYFYIADGIRLGVQKALAECRYQFRYDRWNCPVTATSVLQKTPYTTVNRETSYVQAISAAGVMYYVTKKCTQPKQKLCGCGSRKNEARYDRERGFHWAGCRQDVKFGEKVSKLFFGTDGVSGDTRSMLKRHNERAGHKAVRKKMVTMCKCHGLTGDCSLKTCWKKLSTFRDVGTLLKRKYQKSKDLYNNNKARHLRRTKLSKHSLMFVDSSPNYCKADSAHAGFLGTFGRQCVKRGNDVDNVPLSRWERNSCRRLCNHCGYKTRRLVTEESRDCDCKFAWCCSVECQKCNATVARYYCT